MTATTGKQPEEAAIVSTPQKTNNGVLLVQKLAKLQAKYAIELKTAREKVKPNFLKVE